MIGVIGAGSWGTALAQLYASQGHDARLWARRAALAETINAERESPYLPGLPLDGRLVAVTDFDDLRGAQALLLVVPAQSLRDVLSAARASLPPAAPLVLCCKGIERGSLKLMAAVAAEAAPGHPLAVLSGPTFAADVAAGMPTAATLACADMAVLATLRPLLSARHFRLYPTDDVTGAEVGGALKNVLAIACGAVIGRRLGESARAALIARGFAELTRLGVALGAREETMAGLSGLGDLTLTCSSPRSRNYSLGLALGEGRALADMRAASPSVFEGAETAAAAAALARALGVDAPVTEAVHGVISGAVSLDQAIASLLDRPAPSREAS